MASFNSLRSFSENFHVVPYDRDLSRLLYLYNACPEFRLEVVSRNLLVNFINTVNDHYLIHAIAQMPRDAG